MLLLGSLLAVSIGHAESLPDLLQSVLDHPSIQARRAQSMAAEYQVKAESAKYFGSGSLGATETHFGDDQFMGAFTPASFRNPSFTQNQLEYGANYSLPIDLTGIISANRARAQSDLTIAHLLERQEILMKLHQTLTAWVRLQAISEKKHALNLEQQRVSSTVKRINGEVQAGLLPISDLTLAQSETARNNADQVHLQGERSQLIAMLEDMAGHPIDMSAVDNPASKIRIPSWLVESDHSNILTQIAAQKEISAEQSALVSSRSLLPSLTANAGYTRYNGGGLSENNWYVAARISLPINPSAWHQRDAANALAAAARESKQATERESIRNTMQLKANYETAAAEIKALQQEAKYRQAIVAVQDELAKVGNITTEDVLRHERDLISTVSKLADAKADAITAWSAEQVLNGQDPQSYTHAINFK